VQDGNVVRFRCRVGHAYSPHTLLADGGRQVEAALWTALRALEENAALARRLAARASARGPGRMTERFSDQARELEEHASVLRHVLGTGTWEQLPAADVSGDTVGVPATDTSLGAE
jgi:two-component system chemotaxis response regulator CheB